ncbi:pyridine nucleotide-disulfide oxidoreductase [Bifidobacterium sp. UTBIF-68]|uniref:DsrE/DsrF/DrsH-like family protein n=1 Tax=Bifidobacterium sp. UTBIF-68 TaxID=1465262 RepID=UPI0011299819|nr:DsrE/DsrF/DrsH-like family protein [Bifidobacterium sp. UTBIF-68]TPF91897.1 pyridine nucleotide-disulfide oxidoreductase [Bifidobacterium sp. UTBIF-68]
MTITLKHDHDADDYRHIDANEFAHLDTSSVTLLDLREPDEVLVHPIAGAINIPFENIGHIGNALSDIPKSKPVVVFCRVGDWSAQVCEILADRGYDAVNLDGGYEALREATAGPSEVGRSEGDSSEVGQSKRQSVSDSSSSAAASSSAPVMPPVAPVTLTVPVSSKTQGGSTSSNGTATSQLLHVDAKGLKCPGPIVAVADALRDQPIGTRLKAEATEDAFCSDIAVWAERTGNRLIDLRRDDEGIIHVELEKTAVPTQPAGRSFGANSSSAPASTDAGGDVLHDKTFVVFSGDLDKTIAVFIMANGAAAMGRKVTIFFTFWGLNILRRPKRVRTNKNLIERMFGFMMPRGTRKLGLSRMNMGGLGAAMIRWIMKSKNVASLEELMRQAKEHGVRLVACQMSMDIMGIRKEELIDGVELGGVSTFLGSGETSDMSLFV